MPEEKEKDGATPAPAENTGTPKEETSDEPSHDPVKVELEKERRKEPRSEAEKAAFSLKKNAERAKELGLDPASVLGIEKKATAQESDDDAPMTVAMYKRIEAERAQRSAIQMADDIQDENERELTKVYLQSRIVPSGDPGKDLRDARALVNSVRNGMIAEEVNRRGTGSHHTGSGAPAKREEAFTPTQEEATLMRAYGLTEDHIKKARREQADQRQ